MCVGIGVDLGLYGVHLKLFRCIECGWFNHEYGKKQIHPLLQMYCVQWRDRHSPRSNVLNIPCSFMNLKQPFYSVENYLINVFRWGLPTRGRLFQDWVANFQCYMYGVLTILKPIIFLDLFVNWNNYKTENWYSVGKIYDHWNTRK